MAVRALSSALKTLATCDVVASSARPMRLVEVAKAQGDQRAAVYQRLKTLIDAGLIEQTADGAFRLSLRFQYYSAQAMLQANLGERTAQLLDEIVAESGETASLAVLDNDEAMIVARAESTHVLRADLRVGARLALGSSASGAALLAFGAPETLARLRAAGRHLPSDTELDEVRRNGFAQHRVQLAEQVPAVAAPVFDASGACIAVIAVSGPASRFDYARCGAVAMASARRLSSRMGRKP